MGWRTPVVSLLIISASGGFTGEFVYAPRPGPGNLIYSNTASAGTDPFGNPYKIGSTSYNPALNLAVQIYNGGILFYTPGAPAAAGSIGVSVSSDTMLIESPQAAGHNQVVLALQGGLPHGSIFAEFITQFIIGSSTPDGTDLLEVQGAAAVTSLDTILSGAYETWHTLTLGNGWSGTLRYRLRAENEVSLDGRQLTAGTLTSGTIIATLPAGYRPTSEVRVKSSVSPTPTALADPQVLIESTGSIEVASLPASTTAMSLECRFPLD